MSTHNYINKQQELKKFFFPFLKSIIFIKQHATWFLLIFIQKSGPVLINDSLIISTQILTKYLKKLELLLKLQSVYSHLNLKVDSYN